MVAVLLLPAFGLAADCSGSVTAILDGDTIEVLHTNRAERIRLNGIGCPDYTHVARQNRFEFSSAVEVAGYRVAGNCP